MARAYEVHYTTIMLKKLLFVVIAVLALALTVQIFLPTIVGALKIAVNLLAVLGVVIGGYFIYKRIKR